MHHNSTFSLKSYTCFVIMNDLHSPFFKYQKKTVIDKECSEGYSPIHSTHPLLLVFSNWTVPHILLFAHPFFFESQTISCIYLFENYSLGPDFKKRALLVYALVNICTHYTRSIKIAKSRYKVFIERMWKISGGIRGEGYVEDFFLKVRVENIKVWVKPVIILAV